MGRSGKYIGAVMVFGGAIVTAIDVLADTVRGVINHFGTGQLIVALVALLIVVVGGVLLLVAGDMSGSSD